MEHPDFTNEYEQRNMTHEVRDIFCYLLLDFRVKTGQIFISR